MKGFLFDLDGTLVDTAIDMLEALRILAAEDGIVVEPDYNEYKQLITYGSKAIVSSIYGELQQAEFAKLQQRYLTIYANILTQGSGLFAGIDAVIQQLDENNIPWGIITNKPKYLAEPLVKSLKQLQNCQLLIGGDSYQYAKPHPHGLLKAMQIMQLNPQNSWYIGDAKSDIDAGNAAKMNTAVALWGYLASDDEPQLWQADILLADCSQILHL